MIKLNEKLKSVNLLYLSLSYHRNKYTEFLGLEYLDDSRYSDGLLISVDSDF